MIKNEIIEGFSVWDIPSGLGGIYLEGKPSEKREQELLRKTAEKRKNWQPNEAALSLFEKLKLLTNKQIIIQLWSDEMAFDEYLGQFPFSCFVVKVFIQKVKEEDRTFDQLFIEVKDPEIIDNGNDGGAPDLHEYFISESGTYIFNCSLFSELEVKHYTKTNDRYSFN